MPEVLRWPTVATAAAASFQDPLAYRSVPAEATYTPPKPANTTTLYDFIASRPDLSRLYEALKQPAGFKEAFATSPTWDFTFFAPNNEAFEATGEYFETFGKTPKGQWWLGNTLLHHYVPNSILETSSFNETYLRFQMATYLFVGAQMQDDELVLNQVARVVESDIPVTRGVVHIIDRILDPAAQIHEPDLPWIEQGFIAGSCSKPELGYC
ncbi:FAS1 domain-containing protein [Aspergillus filifer]